MTAINADERLIDRSALPADGLVDCVRRRDAAGVERLLACRRRTDREWYALTIALADMVAAAESGGEKRCTRCGERRPFSEFSAHPSRPYGVQDWCKGCEHSGRPVAVLELPGLEEAP